MTSEQAVAGIDRSLRVLVVDDEPSISQLLSMALRYDGWQVEVAANGAEAVSRATEFGPDVMVLDIMLPDFDGMQVLSRLRAGGDLVPVLFLSALGLCVPVSRATPIGRNTNRADSASAIPK